MKLHSIFTTAFMVASTLNAFAGDFLDTDQPSSLFTLGVRAGVNTSIHTFDSRFFDVWNVNSWGTGIDAGAVFDINLRQYISIQPGFFFESRSGHYSYINAYTDADEEEAQYTQLGKYRGYFLNIPVLISVKFNLASNVKWIVEAGPYLQLKLHSSDNENIDVMTFPEKDVIALEKVSANSSDFGLKIGSGILVNEHYSFSIHYLAGGRDVWKAPFDGGRNKAWTFTVGYNF
ncbi:MAG: PorT family protein [Muribaculaceae bacterium]|nr:PorT family protein [Muribaculaceae bacterium]